MSHRIGEQRSAGFWPLAFVFALFVLTIAAAEILLQSVGEAAA